jgi:thymidylate kinase
MVKIISLSGVDGAGKTTLANTVASKYLKERKMTKIVHIGGIIKTNISTSLQNEGKAGTIYYILTMLKDYLHIILSCILNLRKDVIIYDRYIYDTIIKVWYRTNKKIKPLDHFFVSISPRASSFLIITAPKNSFLRDNDKNEEYHKKKHSFYNELAKKYNLYSIKNFNLKMAKKSILEKLI